MELKTTLSCPLGSKCEEVREGAIHRCAWFVQLAGQNPQTGEQVDERGCAMSWLPILLVENAKVARGTSSAVESFRNDMVRSNEVGVQAIAAMTGTAPLQIDAFLSAKK